MFLKALPLLLLSSVLSLAAPLKTGEAVQPFSAKDQHEATFEYRAGEYRVLVFSFEMGTGKATNNWLAKKGAQFLPENKIVFLASIHGMPGIGRMFALPKMKKYPHRIILLDDAALIDRFPKEDGKLTVLRLNPQGGVQEILFLDPDKDLEKAFRP